MKTFDRSRHLKGLLLKISVITGWQVPDNKEYVTILNDQIAKKAVDEWQTINFDELEYAIRTYGTTVKDWGKLLNLALIDECITSYLHERSKLSEMEESLRRDEQQYVQDPETGQRTPVKELLYAPLVDWSEEWQTIVKQAKNGKIYEAIIIVPIYDWLARIGKVELSGAEKWEIVEACKANHIEEMEHALATLTEKPHVALEKIKRLKAEDWRKDRELLSLMSNLGKIEIVRQLAIMEAAND